jgi:hypothetical protein
MLSGCIIFLRALLALLLSTCVESSLLKFLSLRESIRSKFDAAFGDEPNSAPAGASEMTMPVFSTSVARVVETPMEEVDRWIAEVTEATGEKINEEVKRF